MKLATAGKAVGRATLYGWERTLPPACRAWWMAGVRNASPSPRLLAFNLPGGMPLKMRLSAGTVVEVSEGRFAIEINIKQGANKAGMEAGSKAV